MKRRNYCISSGEFRYFNHRELTTEAGDALHPSSRRPNTDQGPDFRNARITIGDTSREGAVELQSEPPTGCATAIPAIRITQNVILHVVWENDTAEAAAGIPILILRDRTSKLPLAPLSAIHDQPILCSL